MRMLDSSAADEPEVEVTRTDQAHINRFSNLSSLYEDIEGRLQAKRDELEYLSELEMELMMLDDEELVMYKLETSFVHMVPSKATELTEANKEKLSKTVEDLQAELEQCDGEMQELKKKLYSKFGKAIHLERGDSA